MAAPETQSAVTLIKEGFRKAGVKEAQLTGDADYANATTTWMEEIKNDIQIAKQGRKLKPLQTNAIAISVLGQSKYANPTDFVEHISMEIMDGTNTGKATAGASSTITLVAGHGETTASIQGKEIAIYTGTGLRQVRECISIATNVLTVSPDWGTTPDSTSEYMIIDSYKDIVGPHHIGLMGDDRTTLTRGEPEKYYSRGDSNDGEFQLFPVPYRTEVDWNSVGRVWIIRLWYYADLQELDLSTSALLTTLYKRWRNIWVQGIKVRKLERLSDRRYTGELALYNQMIETLLIKETYENNLSNMQATVEG